MLVSKKAIEIVAEWQFTYGCCLMKAVLTEYGHHLPPEAFAKIMRMATTPFQNAPDEIKKEYFKIAKPITEAAAKEIIKGITQPFDPVSN